MSKAFVVRYAMRPDTVDENEALVRAVITELAEKAPEGVRYAAFRLDDGTFVHVGTMDDGAPELTDLAAFAEFRREFAQRAASAPESGDGVLIGSYGFGS